MTKKAFHDQTVQFFIESKLVFWTSPYFRILFA